MVLGCLLPPSTRFPVSDDYLANVLIPDQERRRRLIRRHHLAASATTPKEAVSSVAAFHSTDPITPYLGMRARIRGFTIADLDRALWDSRELWRLHAMRRTLFIVPVEQAPHFLVGTSREIARKERSRLLGWLETTMPRQRAETWLDELADRTVEFLSQGGEWSTTDLTSQVPGMATEIEIGSGRWATTTPVSSRLLLLTAIEGRILRTRPAGTWRSSQYRWAATSWWWPDPPDLDGSEIDARRETLRQYLASHGPATMNDVRWWTGWKVSDIRAALATLPTTTVELESGDEGLILADDLESEDPPPSPVVAFLPGLDPTPMGWKERNWYLGKHGPLVFDRNGNVGPTVWVDGRIVGGWAQDRDGTVVYRLLEEIDADAAARVAEEAEALTAWLDGQVVSTRFPSPLEKELAPR